MESWIRFAEDWLHGQKSKGAKSLYLPAGNTCVPIYEALNSPTSILNDFQLYQIDEVITGRKAGMFSVFFQEHLSQLSRPVLPIGDGEAKADLAWLGLGLNGHVGFHEPGLPKDFDAGCVRLEQKTCETLELEPVTWGVTYGVGRFLKSQAILMFVRGQSKSKVVDRLLSGDADLPAAHLREHKNFDLLCEGL